ncbi:glycosyltransferase family 2 protein [Desulfovibrio sp.]|uniref:glycosyltransferase family 2 protein n=1 Tax=Desulfovibrio sp. TaxID=885 RepID=UPI0025BA8411|nr:glycosyltransferase family 2 protein [Desulfovibrio sp.]
MPMVSNASKAIGTVILNYKRWEETIACLESVIASTTPPAWIVIVDNASNNESIIKLREWGAKSIAAKAGGATHQVEAMQFDNFIDYDHESRELPPPASIILLRLPQNKGYAAGNNAGIRLLLQCGAEAVWILNNDTVVEKYALEAMQKRLFSKKRPGLCGSLIIYRGTNTVQCRGGGRTTPWTGLSYLDGYKFTVSEALADTSDAVEKRINFIYGASVMVSRAFIETVGLMDERYFLYCEEQDWAYAANGAFDLAYAADAIVHHNEGLTTGFYSKQANLKSLYYLTRSRILLTAKHHPWALPTVGLSIVFAALRMFWRRVCCP